MNFLKKVSQSIIIDIIKGVLSFFVLNGGFFYLLDYFSERSSLLKKPWIFWILIISIAILIGIILYKRFNRNTPYFQSINPDFEIIEQKIIHHVKSEQSYLHRREYKLKALRNDLDRFRGKFSWTGDSFEMRSGDDKHKVLLSKKRNVFNTYLIDFDRSYKKNEIIEAVIEWDLFGSGRPFISSKIEEPTNKLTLSIKFDKSIKVSEVEYEENYIEAAKRILNHACLKVKNNKVEHVIDNPKLLHLYELRWKW